MIQELSAMTDKRGITNLNKVSNNRHVCNKRIHLIIRDGTTDSNAGSIETSMERNVQEVKGSFKIFIIKLGNNVINFLPVVVGKAY